MLQELSKPFRADQIHWRVGARTRDKSKGIALAYLDARDVMDRLDEAVGAQNWQNLVKETPSGRVLCTLSIYIDGEWIAKSDGAGDTQVEGEKGAISDALKRAAVLWGVGRYLYRLPNVWCKLKNEKYLDETPSLPAWALPSGENQGTPAVAGPQTRDVRLDALKAIARDVHEVIGGDKGELWSAVLDVATPWEEITEEAASTIKNTIVDQLSKEKS